VLVILGVAWIPVVVALIRGYGFEKWDLWIGLTVLYFLIAPAILQLIESRSRLNAEYRCLEVEIKAETERLITEKDRILAETETLAVSRIQKLKEEIIARREQMLSIEEEIKYKRKWRSEFARFPKILEENVRLDQSAESTIAETAREVERLREERYGWRYKYDRTLRHLDTWTNGYRNYPWLRFRFERMISWVPTDRNWNEDSESEYFYGEAERLEENEHLNDDAERYASDVEQREDEAVSIQPIIERSLRPLTDVVPDTQALLFDEFLLNERPLEEAPNQRARLPRHKSIKISNSLRAQINEKKFRIGWLGELAVLEFEADRISAEVRSEGREIIHTSTINDAAGYDIQSWDGADKIYIEVKTTVGDFWSNLYFTQNELDSMKALDTKYCLYRVCNFNIESGEGDLFIYRGADLILDTFEFNSKVYLLSEKQRSDETN